MLTYKRSLLLLLCLSLLCLSSPSSGKPAATAPINYDQVKELVSELIIKEMKKNDVTGLSIALVDDQQVVWARGFGYADEKNEREATPETVYRIGSLTDLFTATAAMQLVEQGGFDIDQPLKNYLPEFSIHTRFTTTSQITPRMLMTHHSGLPSALQKGMWSSRPEPFTEVATLINNEYAAYPPGYLFSYSTIGATLLGHAVERASGREYTSFIHDSLLQPLAMTHSGFFQRRENGFLSKGYNNGREIADPPVRDIPANGLYSTALDLSRFMEMIFAHGRSGNHQVLKQETISEMFRPQNVHVPLDLGLRMGLGWALSGLGDIDIQNAGIVAHHAGTSLLFHNQIILLPGHALGVVVLANSSTASKVVNKVAVRAITLALEAKAGIRQPEQKKPVIVDALLAQEVQQDYAGHYASLAGLATIKSKEDHLHVEVMNRTFQLLPLADGRYGIKYRLLGLFEFSLGELDYYELSRATVAGREILLTSTKGRDMVIAEKIRQQPVPDAWLKRVGQYRIENQGDDFPLLEDIRLRLDDGVLLAECAVPFFFKGVARMPLLAISDTEAVVAGLGRGMGETIRVVPGNGGATLLYSGYVLKRKEE